MNRDEVLEHVCATVALVYHSIGDFSQPSDGFCRKCPAQRLGDEWHFQHSGDTVKFVREAVINELKRRHITPNDDVMAELDQT